MTDYKSLLAQKAELDAKIAAVQAERKAQAVTQARALTMEFGLTSADLFPVAGKAKATGSVGQAKYCDPVTGITWTGRGKPPNWILGKHRGQFLFHATK